MDVIRSEVMSDAARHRFERELRTILQQEAGTSSDEARRKAATARLAALEGEIARLVDAIVQVGTSEALSVRLKSTEIE
jgi:hypothetical protein